jgi:DNA-binding SARP family transcriptional activator
LLAGLLLHANMIVSTDLIEHWLWDSDTNRPKQAKNAIQTYVMRLRKAFGGADVVRTVPGGYRLDADESAVDVLRFEALLARADADAGLLTEALDLWRGPALTGVVSDALQRDEAPRLAERRLDAWQRLIDARLAAGESPVAELRRLTREHPLRERFWEQLVRALHLAGRQADAVAAYRRAAAVLAEETGLDPGPVLRSLHERVLAGDSLAASPAPVDWVAPRQLPQDVTGFTGRVAELAALWPAGTALVSVEGTAGVGKTALVLHLAHLVADEFPDGQVYLNLRGYGPGEPRDEQSSLDLLLQAVGVRPDQLPAAATAREAMWRSRTAGRRMVVVLDNVRSTTQVRPLLPGPGSLVLVTSRNELRGLVARDGARRLTLARLTETEARDLLAEAVGRARVDADPAGSDAFLTRCAHLPLAIRILGERASRFPALSLSEFLRDVDGLAGLAGFDLDDDDESDLRAVFAPSYEALCDASARMFRLLGGHPGPEFGVPAAAASLSAPLAETRRLLGELVRAHLLEERRPGRYEFHDLLREYAAELLGAEGGTAVVDWYVAAALGAFTAAERGVAAGGIDVEPAMAFADRAAAIDWFEQEWANLVAAVEYAHARGHDRQTWQLARLMQALLIPGGHPSDVHAAHTLGLASARRLGDARGEAYMLNGLGVVLSRLGRHREAIDHFEQRLARARTLGDRKGERAALTNLIVPYQRVGQLPMALDAARSAVAIGEEVGPPGRLAIALNNLAEVLLLLDQPERAVQEAERAYELARDGASLRCLGRGYAGLGEPTRGAELLCRAAEWFAANDSTFDEADTRHHLGDLFRSTGEHERAFAEWTAALALFERQGHPDAGRVRTKLMELTHAR